MQIRPTAFTIGLIIHFSIALFCVYTEFGIDSCFYLNIAIITTARNFKESAHLADTVFITAVIY